jgi:ribose/xylose/arabinose/galactoside ABC-type transport system permease subunit
MGGKGSLKGVVLGTCFVILLESFVIVTGMGLFYGDMVKGLIIIIMVINDLRERLKPEKKSLNSW